MDAFETIRSRASALRLGEPAPTRKQLEAILAAGLNAPDHGRLTPWRYLVLQDDAIDVLGRAMGALKRKQSPDASEDKIEAARLKARRAPVIIVAAARIAKGHNIPEIEQVLAVGAAVENMILAAHSLGLGTMWKTGDAAYDPEVRQALGFAAEDQIVAFLYLGTPLTPGTPHSSDASKHVRWLGRGATP
jgi:nitroreductase